MRKLLSLPVLACASLVLAAFFLQCTEAQPSMTATDEGTLGQLRRNWTLEWNSANPCSTPWLTCDTDGSVTAIDLHDRALGGGIPDSITKLSRLYNLTLSGNNLTGGIPKDLGGLKNLSYIYLDQNLLNGTIPENIGLLALQGVKFNDNYLTGKIPETLLKFPGSSFWNNCFSNMPAGQDPGSLTRCLSSPPPGSGTSAPPPPNGTLNSSVIAPSPSRGFSAPPPPSKPRRKLDWWVWLLVVVGSVAVAASIVAYLCLRKKWGDTPYSELELDKAGISAVASYTMPRLRSMTDNWSDENLIGKGGYGSVYRGSLGDEVVAVKKLKLGVGTDEDKGRSEFLNEVSILSKVRHKNLVGLKGYCYTQGERMLIMDYVDNGSLADHLFYRKDKELPVLDWPTRCRIALTSAQALHYLHSLNDERIIHRDVKPGNILLDKDYNTFVCDFGLAKLMAQFLTRTAPTMATVNVAGTQGYMAPEWLVQGIVSDKIDVYSFGVVLLELVTGKTRFMPYSLGEPPDVLYSVQEAAWIVCTTRPDWLHHMLDPDLEDVPHEEASTMLRIALHCISKERRDRPRMERVVGYLKGDIDIPLLPIQRPGWLREGMDGSSHFNTGSKSLPSGRSTSQETSAGRDRKSDSEEKSGQIELTVLDSSEHLKSS